MKQALRSILVYSVAIALASMILPGIDYGKNFTTLILTAVVLGISNTFIRPILALILLPVNIITLGLVGLFMNAIILFIVTLLVPNFNIIPFDFVLGSSLIHLSIFWSYLVCSMVLSFVGGLVRKIVNS